MRDPHREPAPVPVRPDAEGDDPALGLFQVLREDGTAREAWLPSLGPKTLRAMFRHMLRVRLLDERMMMRQRQGKVGFYGAITGQEATPIASGFALRTEDWVFPALRESAIMLVRGFPLTTYVAQVYGNAGDVLKGRQMPSHMSGRAVNQVAWSSCLGPQLPQAVGAAMAAKHRGDKAVVLGFIGDGATSEPDFHAAMNFAGVYRPPVVLICQNNHWAISVPSSKQSASATFAVKARAYGIPGVRVDGNDVLGTYRVVKEAVDRARDGEGPTFIEAVTYRIGAHSSSDDPTRYRSEAEVEAWRQKDPLQRFERFLRSEGHLTGDQREAMEAELEAEIKAAIRKVEAMERPATATLFEDVYATRPWHLREQEDELRAAPPPPEHG
ncbi:MAG: thiamine pyrophosphate-dependent enzyme [Myxococcota bacterium]